MRKLLRGTPLRWFKLNESKPEGHVVLRFALFPKTIYLARYENKMWYLLLKDTYIVTSPDDEWSVIV